MNSQLDPGARRRSQQRGAGSVLVAGAMCLLVFVMIAAILVIAALSVARQVRAAADLVALGAAQAQAAGRSACQRAEKLAETNAVTLDECTSEIGEGEFVVTVRVSALALSVGSYKHRIAAAAAAGHLSDG